MFSNTMVAALSARELPGYVLDVAVLACDFQTSLVAVG